jgi:hypothetical protein
MSYWHLQRDIDKGNEWEDERARYIEARRLSDDSQREPQDSMRQCLFGDDHRSPD